jgi:hypothetical protein
MEYPAARSLEQLVSRTAKAYSSRPTASSTAQTLSHELEDSGDLFARHVELLDDLVDAEILEVLTSKLQLTGSRVGRHAGSRRAPELLDLPQPRRQLVPTGDNPGHYSNGLRLTNATRRFAHGDRISGRRSKNNRSQAAGEVQSAVNNLRRRSTMC